jgi:flagellar motor switch protein FliN
MTGSFKEREFVEEWGEEFARAIEIFAGSKPDVICTPQSGAVSKITGVDEYLWWKQGFEVSAGGFLTWIGASESTWSALGASMASETAGPKQIYLELLAQAQEEAAKRLSREMGKPVRCKTGQAEETCSSAVSNFWEIKVTFSGSELPPIIYVVDLSKNDGANLSHRQERSRISELGHVAEEHSYGSRVEQLLDLDLPMSVVLGHRTIQIQDVLKLTSGSVIELDSTINDRVEILVHGKLVARGEVVSVKGNYGVRITDVISRQERLGLEGVLGGRKVV